MYDSYLNMQCTTLADCFVLSGKNGWDTHDFINKLFKTKWGRNILTGKAINEFTCEGFMYEGLLKALKFKSGNTYPEKILWFTGYLYRYLCESCSLKDVYNKVSIDLIRKRYGFYHTQDWDYIKMDLNL